MTSHDACRALLAETDRLMSAGDRRAAVAHLKEGLRPAPELFAGWIRLARLHYEDGEYAEAIDATQIAERVDPHQSAFAQVRQAMARRDPQAAHARAQAMLDASPGHPRAVFTLAHLAQAEGDFEAAADILGSGLDHMPANLTLRRMQIDALEQSGRYADAVDAAARLAEIENSFTALWSLITVLLRYGRSEAALEACDRASAHCDGDPRRRSALYLVRGQVHRILGRRRESIDAFHESLSSDPLNTSAWWGLADLKTYRFEPDEISALEDICGRADLPAPQRSLSHFALAKAREMTGDWSAATPLYLRANALAGASFDAARFEAAADRLIQAFGPEALARRAPQGARPVPVFIVGLPRSGSTLVEHILASHSQVEGTIEQPTLPAVKRRAHKDCVQRLGGDYLSRVGLLSESGLSELGAAYLENGAFFRTGETPFFTDKLPHNFEHVGLIHKILPDARIIDVRRHPLDCGFSLFRQHFTQGNTYAYDLAAIGRYYNGYLKIMDHWDAVLPGRVFRVNYEHLVGSTEEVVRALLSHIGVGFEPDCLEAHKSTRPVRTASSEQVRSKITGEGIGVWKNAEQELEPLKAALGQDTLDRFRTHD